jgi:hypothetical protein
VDIPEVDDDEIAFVQKEIERLQKELQASEEEVRIKVSLRYSHYINVHCVE